MIWGRERGKEFGRVELEDDGKDGFDEGPDEDERADEKGEGDDDEIMSGGNGSAELIADNEYENNEKNVGDAAVDEGSDVE